MTPVSRGLLANKLTSLWLGGASWHLPTKGTWAFVFPRHVFQPQLFLVQPLPGLRYFPLQVSTTVTALGKLPLALARLSPLPYTPHTPSTLNHSGFLKHTPLSARGTLALSLP